MDEQEATEIAADHRQMASVPARMEVPRRITSASLLQGQRQIVIEHVGREYRLHLTAKGKLILTG